MGIDLDGLTSIAKKISDVCMIKRVRQGAAIFILISGRLTHTSSPRQIHTDLT